MLQNTHISILGIRNITHINKSTINKSCCASLLLELNNIVNEWIFALWLCSAIIGLYEAWSLLNIVNISAEDGADKYKLSGFPLGLPTSRAILGSSWIFDFHH